MGIVEKMIGKAIIMVGKNLSQQLSRNNYGDHRPPSCGAAVLVRK